ncbi:LytTR family DNA-binding domain-containing protein [Oscillibacter sp.]|uniref:LytR/AlgR family response regulator transcription factor n=1 Tax=Oscillibacter sp. TaxID=1945593 RepID=UPI002896C961|nr:LytTR family DNA-binding domain-containing protein [Oscillibacter sp.]
MRVAICDDSVHDAELICALLREHFEKNGFAGELYTFSSGEALEKAFAACPFDAVFLDIYMGGMNGLETAQRLRETDCDFSLVFITTSRDHALDSFSLGTNDYVVKPIKRGEIDRAFTRCRDVFLKNGRFIEVVSNRMKQKIPLNKIQFMEVYGKEIFIHTSAGTIKASLPLDELEKMVTGTFLRCHRSYIVNLNHVEAIGQDDFRMRDGSLVPLRQRGRAELRDAYADFLSDRLFEAPS